MCTLCRTTKIEVKKDAIIGHKFDNYHIDIAALSETRLSEKVSM